MKENSDLYHHGVYCQRSPPQRNRLIPRKWNEELGELHGALHSWGARGSFLETLLSAVTFPF